MRSFSGSVSKTWNSINPATLSGAIDVVVVEQEDGYMPEFDIMMQSLMVAQARWLALHSTFVSGNSRCLGRMKRRYTSRRHLK